jgi:hypothetical protein
VGRPEWRPERGITGSTVEAQAQAMISQPRPGYSGFIHRIIAAAAAALRRGYPLRPGYWPVEPERRFRVWTTGRRAR